MLKILPIRWSRLGLPLFLLGIAISAFLFTLSPSYRNCVTGPEHAYSEDRQTDFFGRPLTFVVCEAMSIDANGVLITALATIAIAIFNFTLWQVTGKSVDLARDEFMATH